MNEMYLYKCNKYDSYHGRCNGIYKTHKCIFNDIIIFNSNQVEFRSINYIACYKGDIKIDWVNNIKYKSIIKEYCK